MPVVIESAILMMISFLNFSFINNHPNLIACCLLFAMGLQNALVTIISNSVVRTTHLTGLFTDLGIEFSQLFFYKDDEHRNKLISSIKLRFTIVFTFFIGGIIAGLLYHEIQMKTLILASMILIIGLGIDYFIIRLRLKKLRRTN